MARFFQLIGVAVVAGVFLLFVLVAFVVTGPALAPTRSYSSPPSSRGKARSSDCGHSDKLQYQGFIDKAIELRIFTKVTKLSQIPRVWIDVAWYTLDFEQKQRAILTVFKFYNCKDPDCYAVIVREPINGKTIGRFSMRTLLEIY